MRRSLALLAEHRRLVIAGALLGLTATAVAVLLMVSPRPESTTLGATLLQPTPSPQEPLRLPTPWRIPPTPGWVTYRSPDGTYSFSTPPEWTALSLLEPGARDRLVALAGETPGWSSYLEAADDAELWDEIQVVALGPDAARFTVSHQMLPQPVSLALYAGLVQSQLASLGATGITIDDASLSGEDAKRLRYELSLPDESGREFGVEGVLIVAFRDGGVYVLTFTAPAEHYSRYRPLFADMTNRFSFRSEES